MSDLSAFKLPEIDPAAAPEFTDGASCKAWLENVPLANVSTAQHQLLVQVEEFNRTACGAKARFEALEAIELALQPRRPMFDDDQFIGVQEVEQLLRQLRLNGPGGGVLDFDQALLDAFLLNHIQVLVDRFRELSQRVIQFAAGIDASPAANLKVQQDRE